METENLVYLKQTLYVGGIGGQVDSGAWEKLEPDKRIEGFDHSFLWLRKGHVILGRLWSSADRKGRSKYPMVLCADIEGAAPPFLLAKFQLELERLRDACKTASTADQVIAECKAAQDRLQLLPNANAGQTFDPLPSVENRKTFLESKEFGADRVGMLRVLHELFSKNGIPIGGSRPEATGKGRSGHVRVPLAADSPGAAMLLWTSFLRCAVPETVPFLLIARTGTNWIDLLAGEPVAEDFFCLQASPKALPLASEIPYELTAGSREQLRTLESIFLAVSADSRPSRFDQIPSPAKPKSGNNKTPRQSSWKMWSGIGGGVILLIVVAFVMFSGKQPTQRAKTPPNSHSPATPVQSDQKTSTNKVQFDAFITRGKKAMDDKNFEEAARQFEQALRIFPDNATAKNDLLQTQESLKKASVDVEFSNALRAAQKAFDAQQFDEALTNLAKAQALNPNDPQAIELATRAKQRQQAAQVERTYADAVKAAQQALNDGNFDEVIHQGKLALIAKPDDSVATSLLQKGEDGKAELEKRDAAYNTAMTAARQALNAKKYDDAIEQAQAALKIKPPDLNAKQIIQVAQQGKTVIAAQAQIQVAYEKALAAAQKALNNSNYDEAARMAQAALKSKPDDDEASQLLALAKGKMAASVSATATVEASPAVSLSPGSDAFTNAIGMVFIRVANAGPGVAFVGKYEVTQKQFREVMRSLPDQPVFQDDLPVENISFEEATNFCNRLSKREGKSYALPTKAEWLAMANLTPQEEPTAWAYFTNHFASVEVTSWNRETPLMAPARGGSLGAQTNGLCDLFGNVREWIAGDVSAGFSYDTQGHLPRSELFSTYPYLKIVTGFRCLIRAGNPPD